MAPADAIEVKVENPLTEPRAETISVSVADLRRIIPTLEPEHLVVADTSGAEVLSQLIDRDGDQGSDEIVFQVSLTARETKVLRIQSGERQPFRPEQYKVYGRFVRERFDDFAWENDRIAHRVYGPALETAKIEPLTSSGIDVWAKRVRRLVINDWYMTDDYHRDHGEGADLYSVHGARGCGGVGVWADGKLFVSKNFSRSRVMANGPLRLAFELEYAPWQVGSRKVSEVRRVTLDAGSNFGRYESRLKTEAGPRPTTMAIGIAKHPGGKPVLDKQLGLLRSWEPLKGDSGHFGCGLVVSPESLADYAETDSDFLLIANEPPNGDQTYYAGFGWDRSGDFADEAAWTKYAEAYARARRIPLRVSLTSAAKRAASAAEPTTTWAERICDSYVTHAPQGPWDRWGYEGGLLLRGCEQLGLKTSNKKYLDYVKTSVDQVVALDGSIKGYELDDYSLDNINPDKLLFSLAAHSDGKEKARYTAAILSLRGQLKTQPRTSDGGFWHKNIYPSQMWLDGLYMAAPFLSEFGATVKDPAAHEEAVKQIALMEKHARDPKTGLLYHGWDESKKQRWANPSTGLSAEFWGRAMGWYAMAVVDTLEFLPEKHAKRAELLALLGRLADAIAASQDKDTGVWWQVLNKPRAPGNYLESSASAMFVYSLSKAVRKGWLDRQRFEAVAKRGYEGLLAQFASIDVHGNFELRSVCKVAGLGGNPYRDGSYDYYVNTDVVSNDPKGVGAFILASVEREALARAQ